LPGNQFPGPDLDKLAVGHRRMIVFWFFLNDF